MVTRDPPNMAEGSICLTEFEDIKKKVLNFFLITAKHMVNSALQNESLSSAKEF
jgi:hypothetical protein